jgi:hypothetical protein
MPNYVPGTPSSLATLGAVGLRKIAWAETVKQDSVRPSVFTSPELAANFQLNNGEIIIEKKGLMLNLENVGQASSAQSVRCGMQTGLRKRAQYGTGEDMLGNGDEGGLLWAEFFYNEIKKAAKMYQWGYNFNDTAYLGLNAGNGKLLSNFHAENDDTRFQQALQVQYADELTYAPVSKVPQLNPNFLIPNIAYSTNPAYDIDALTVTDGAADADLFYPDRTYGGAGTYVQNVAAAMLSASGTGATPNAVLNVDHLAAITTYLQDFHVVEPIELDGQITWILKIGPKTKGYLFNPQVSGSLGSYFTSVAQYKSSERDLIPGEFGRVFDHFVVVVDWRTPTCTISGAAGSYTMKYGYVQPANNDDRNNSAWANTSGATNYVFEMNAIMGSNALARYRRDDMKANLAETTEFGKIKEAGTYKGEGISLPIFNIDTATASSHIYRGSCIVPHSVAAIDTLV